MKVTMMIYLNQYILLLYQLYDSVLDHPIDMSKYNPLAGSNYIKLSNVLNRRKKGLINI